MASGYLWLPKKKPRPAAGCLVSTLCILQFLHELGGWAFLPGTKPLRKGKRQFQNSQHVTLRFHRGTEGSGFKRMSKLSLCNLTKTKNKNTSNGHSRPVLWQGHASASGGRCWAVSTVLALALRAASVPSPARIAQRRFLRTWTHVWAQNRSK